MGNRVGGDTSNISLLRDSIRRTTLRWFVGFKKQQQNLGPVSRKGRRKISGEEMLQMGFPQRGREVAERGQSYGHMTRNKNYSKVLGTREGQSPWSCITLPHL